MNKKVFGQRLALSGVLGGRASCFQHLPLTLGGSIFKKEEEKHYFWE
jgi:hypothetical protein